MKRAALAALDWFIPNASVIERSEIGLARNFVLTHLLGPFVILSIVALIFAADPNPGLACWAMMACGATFWLLPFGLKLTRDMRLMALISVELLCVTSLIGTTFYGGVNSPLLPWLLVSLMLGFFYLSDHALPVLALFAFNIFALIGIHAVHSFPQGLSPAQLETVSWFSMFSATGYMSVMATYYAGIITVGSTLERETERHGLMADRLRQAKLQADLASEGKTIFLAKMRHKFEQPLTQLVAAGQALSARLVREPSLASWAPEVDRINQSGTRLLRLVRETVDPRRVALEDDAEPAEAISIVNFIERLAQASQALMLSHGLELTVESGVDAGRLQVDAGKLSQVFDILLARIASVAPPGRVRLKIARERRSTGDWITIQIRPVPARVERRVAPPPAPEWDLSDPLRADPSCEKAQVLCAILGGGFDFNREPRHGLSVILEVPAVSPHQRDRTTLAA